MGYRYFSKRESGNKIFLSLGKKCYHWQIFWFFFIYIQFVVILTKLNVQFGVIYTKLNIQYLVIYTKLNIQFVVMYSKLYNVYSIYGHLYKVKRHAYRKWLNIRKRRFLCDVTNTRYFCKSWIMLNSNITVLYCMCTKWLNRLWENTNKVCSINVYSLKRFVVTLSLHRLLVFFNFVQEGY